jgi:hypothetical protein
MYGLPMGSASQQPPLKTNRVELSYMLIGVIGAFTFHILLAVLVTLSLAGHPVTQFYPVDTVTMRDSVVSISALIGEQKFWFCPQASLFSAELSGCIQSQSS